MKYSLCKACGGNEYECDCFEKEVLATIGKKKEARG